MRISIPKILLIVCLCLVIVGGIRIIDDNAKLDFAVDKLTSVLETGSEYLNKHIQFNIGSVQPDFSNTANHLSNH